MTSPLQTGTFYQAQANGLYDSSAEGSSQITCDGQKIIYINPAAIQMWGPMTVSSPVIYAQAAVKTAQFSWIKMFGQTVGRAVLTSFPFSYLDYVNFVTYLAIMEITLTQSGQYGQGGYKLMDTAKNGAIISWTSLDNEYAEKVFTYGYVAITQPASASG